jgi:hypothetical protein
MILLTQFALARFEVHLGLDVHLLGQRFRPEVPDNLEGQRPVIHAILVDPGPDRDKIVGSMVESFFQPVAVDTVAEALEQMRVIQFDSVVLHSKFAGGKLRKSKFHKYMKKMSMVRRRYILYILVGPEFHTLYSLEALSNSANLTINEKDLDHMKTIYKRGKTENDQLFGPYINALKEKGAS